MKKITLCLFTVALTFTLIISANPVSASTSKGKDSSTKTTLSANNVFMTFFFYRDSSYRIKGVKDNFHVMAQYKKSACKKIDGVQYVYAKKKNFKKVYKKGTMKLSTPKKIKVSTKDSGVKGKIGPTISKIKYGKCYVKWRVYKKVNGKKVYSSWKKQHMYMNGFVID